MTTKEDLKKTRAAAKALGYKLVKDEDPSKLRWRHRRGDDYHYYENAKGGYGHVIGPRVSDGKRCYHASAGLRSEDFTRLKDAKAFVEQALQRTTKSREISPTKLGFEPSQDIRDFDGRDFVGRKVVVSLRHQHIIGGSQYISIEGFADGGACYPARTYLCGWVDHTLGSEGEEIECEILSVDLIEHMNGGRSNMRTASTYADFFNDEQKKSVQKRQLGGFEALLSGRGNPDQADLIVKLRAPELDDFQIDSFAWILKAPEEWYSEVYKDDARFLFDDGFYATAEDAITVFSGKASDDLFGTRFFPLLVFPEDKGEQAKEIGYWAKSHSRLIVTNGYAIVGTRCKPDEYAGVITQTYEQGGKVPCNRTWDWE